MHSILISDWLIQLQKNWSWMANWKNITTKLRMISACSHFTKMVSTLTRSSSPKPALEIQTILRPAFTPGTQTQPVLKQTILQNVKPISNSGQLFSSFSWSSLSFCFWCSSVFLMDFTKRTRERTTSLVTTMARIDWSLTTTGRRSQSPSHSTCASEIPIFLTLRSKSLLIDKWKR